MRFFTNIQSITRFFRTSLTLLVLLLSIEAWSQNYPVTCTPIIKPSYSLKWSEISTNNDMFKVHLLLKDLTKISVDVYLKIRLSGVGVDIRTVDGFMPSQTLTLISGEPRMLTASDLAEYFNISNIVVDGVDISALYNSGRLPEGLYTWTVEAYEIDRNRQVSNTGMALMNVFKNYPPIINIPQDGAILPVTTPQNVLFSWTSRSTASLNAAQGKTYKLRIYELSDGDDANMVANSGIAPFREIVTTNPYFAYGSAEPMLKKGHKYAVQVQEEDANGFDDYENEGKSQVVTFSYGKPCVAPEGMVINPIGKGRVELTCEARVEDTETYPVTAWYKTQDAKIWNSVPFNGNSAVISGLKDKTDYEFKLSSACGDNTNTMAALGEGDIPSGDPSTETETFKIDDSEFDEEEPEVLDPAILDPYGIGIEINADGTTRPVETLDGILSKIIKPKCVTDADDYAECSPNHPEPRAITGTIELDALAVGDVLGIYDYAVLVTAIGGGNTLSGKGLVKLPFLDNSFMAVEFSGIKAKKGEAGTQGGCVYEVGDYFRTRPISQADLQNEQVRTIADIIKLTEPTVFHGDLEIAIKKYQEKGSEIASKGTATPQEKQDLLTYTKGVEVAIGTWKDKFSEVFGSGETDPKIAEIVGDITAILTQLNADKQIIESGTPPAGTSYPTIPDLKAKIDAIIEKIKALQQENTPKPPRIQNVLATNIGYNDATLTWQGDPRFTKYVISYKTADGGELIETVSGNRLDLKKLQENSQYGFKIEGYVGDEVVDTYDNGTFKTLENTIKPPQNIKPVYLSDNSVKISWDKDTQHANYALVYRTSTGIEKIVYPTSNEIILFDIDPYEKYNFDVTAFSIAKLNATASGAFSSGEQCKFSLTANKEVINIGETVELTNTCPGTGIVTWSNNTSNAKIISVSLTTTTTYISACTVTVNGKTYTCSAPIEIKVQDVACAIFTISKTIIREGVPTSIFFRQGDKLKLTASGCSGEVLWQNISETFMSEGNSISFYPLSSGTYSAICSNTQCVATITNEVACSISLTTELYQPNGQLQQFKASATCNVGKLRLTITDDPRLRRKDSETHEYKEGYGWFVYKRRPVRKTKAIAECVSENNELICKREVVHETTAKGCEDFKINPKEIEGGKTKLTASGCYSNNVIIWQRQDNPVTTTSNEYIINTPKVPTVYQAKCRNASGCVATIELKPKEEINLKVQPSGFVQITGNKVYESSVTKFSTIGATCDNGEAISWTIPAAATTYEETIADACGTEAKPCIQASLTANKETPFLTNKLYTVNCTSANGTTKSITFSFKNTSTKCLEFVDVPESITMGQSVPLKVAYCVGNVTWTKEVAKIGGFEDVIGLGTGLSVNDSPLISTRYTATCVGMPNCSESIVVEVKPCKSLEVKFLANNEVIKESSGYFNNNGDPVVTNLVKMGTEIVAKATGCEAGSVEWKFDNQTIIGNPISVKPYKTTTYTATCKLNENTLCSSTPFTVSIDKMPPAQLECPELTLSGPPSIVRCQENKVRIDAKGCPNGSFYTWSIKGEGNPTTTTNDFFNVTLSAAKTIECSCTTAYGKTSSAEININTVEPKITVSPEVVYAGITQIIYASGCTSKTNCNEKGELKWRLNNQLISSDEYLKINITQETTYMVSCNEESPTPIKVAVKNGENCPTFNAISQEEKESTVTLTAKACDTNFEIRWYKNTLPKGTCSSETKRSTQPYNEALNKRKVTVQRPEDYTCPDPSNPPSGTFPVNPTDNYTVYCVANNSPCSFAFYVDSPKGYEQNKPKSGGTDTGPSDVTPDPCNKYKWFDKKRISANQSWLLYSAWCENGIVNWYSDAARTQLVTTLIAPTEYKVTNKTIKKYFASCKIPSQGIDCKDAGGAEFKVSNNRIDGGADALSNITNRTSTQTELTNTTAQTCTFTAGNAASGLIAQALCQGVNVWKVDGVINQAKVEEYLQTLVTATIAQMATQGITVSISDDKIATAVAAIMSSGEECSKLAEIANTLTAGNNGIIDADKFNKGVLPKYGEILDQVAPKPPTLTATTITPASCGLNNGSVKLSATGGTPPYQYSKDGTTFQSTNTFEALAIGKYTFYVKDAKEDKATTLVDVIEKYNLSDEISEFEPIQAIANARANDANTVVVQYDSKHQATTITLNGLEGKMIGNLLRITKANSPSNTHLVGDYYVLFNSQDLNQHTGFYKKEYIDDLNKPCLEQHPTRTFNFKSLAIKCHAACVEAFLPDEFFKDPNDYYINKDGFKATKTSLTALQIDKFSRLIKTLNATLGSKIKGTVVAVTKENIDKMLKEAKDKGLTAGEPLLLKDVYIFPFSGDGELGDCEKKHIKDNLTALQGTSFYKALATGGDDRVIVSTTMYFYYSFFAILQCRVAKEKYYTCTKDATNKETCTLKAGASEAEAFVAGFLHSVIEDLDFVEMAAGLITMAKSATTSVATEYLNYPKELYEVYQKAPNTWSGEDIYKIIPPVKPTKESVEFVSNAISFFYSNYITDANYWTSGELTAMVAPAVITGGAYLAKKLPQITSKLAGRLASKVAGLGENLNIVALFKAGKKIDYDDIGDIEQVIVKNNDEIDGIYEKVGNELVPICGFVPKGGRVTTAPRRCIVGKGMTNAHYDKVEEVMGDRADALFAELEDNPNLQAGTVDGIEALAKTKKWRLKPNYTYISNGYTYKTDKYGRIESVEGDLKLDGVERHPDGPNVGEGDGKLPNDVGGHLIGRQYGGAGDATNVVAMEKTVNEYSNAGKFGRHEIRWRRLLNETPRANIQLEIEVIYNSGNFTIRPDKFIVTEKINGIENIISIDNY